MNRLKKLREERHITQEELAFQLNTSQQRISKIERQIVPMGEEMIRACVCFFGVTADYLLGISDIKVEIEVSSSGKRDLTDGFIRDFLYYYNTFNQSQKDLMREIMKAVATCYHRVE